MRRANSHSGLLALCLGLSSLSAATATCDKPVYLTFDTGHMGVAPLVAEVLQRQQVKVTFFIANERTLSGGSSLDGQWQPWWRERAAEGHERKARIKPVRCAEPRQMHHEYERNGRDELHGRRHVLRIGDEPRVDEGERSGDQMRQPRPASGKHEGLQGEMRRLCRHAPRVTTGTITGAA